MIFVPLPLIIIFFRVIALFIDREMNLTLHIQTPGPNLGGLLQGAFKRLPIRGEGGP